MKRNIAFLTVIFFLFASCNEKAVGDRNVEKLIEKDDKINVNINYEIGKLNELLEKMDGSSQFFVFSPKDVASIIGKSGIRFTVNPSDLITEGGQDISDSFKVELKELINQYQMALANAQTISNNRLLVSGGAYFIEITAQGQKLKLKPEKKIKITLPGLSQEGMSLFSGYRDSLERLFWIQEKVNLKEVKDVRAEELAELQNELAMLRKRRLRNDSIPALYKEKMVQSRIIRLKSMIQEDGLYPEIEFGNLEWINCDRFLESDNLTNLTIYFSPTEKIKTANIYLIFKDINSVLQNYYINSNGKEPSITFHNVPLDAKVKLIAYTLKDNKIFACSSKMTIKDNQAISIALNETNETDFKRLFSEQ